MFSLTSEVEEAQMMADNLLCGFLRTEFDSTGEEDISSPPCDEWRVLVRCLYVRYTYDSWKGRGLRAVGQGQVPHRGTFQRCTYGQRNSFLTLLHLFLSSLWRSKRNLPVLMSKNMSRKLTTEQETHLQYMMLMLNPWLRLIPQLT